MSKNETWSAAWASEGMSAKKKNKDDDVNKPMIACVFMFALALFYAGIYFHHSEHWDFEFAEHHFPYFVVPAIVVFAFAMEGRQILQYMKQTCGLPVTVNDGVRHKD